MDGHAGWNKKLIDISQNFVILLSQTRVHEWGSVFFKLKALFGVYFVEFDLKWPIFLTRSVIP